jgi:hypothetical protein
MSNSPAPSTVRINYHSEFGVHSQNICALEWSPPSGGFTYGSFLSWSLVARDADDMIKDLVNVLVTLVPTSVTFDNYTIFTYADETADPVPVASNVLDIDGTNLVPGWYKAVQTTISMRTTNFGLFKLVLLDSASSSSFDPIFGLSPSPALEDIVDQVKDQGNAWSGRDNGRPDVLISQTKTLNEALRKAYRMA